MGNILFGRASYLNNDIPFLISTYIREYDMSKSNISILKHKNYLSQEDYDYYASLPKQDRQRQIGLLQLKDPEVISILRDGMNEMRNEFIYRNELDKSNVLSIKNDAFFVIDKIPRYTTFNNIEFRLKNTYTSYYKINNIELYYLYNQIDNQEDLEIKGISGENMILHDNYFIDILKTVFCSAQTEPIQETVSLLSTIYENYIQRKLPIDYYRELDSSSKLRLSVNGVPFMADTLNEDNKSWVDISCNLNILRTIMSYYTSILQRMR